MIDRLIATTVKSFINTSALLSAFCTVSTHKKVTSVHGVHHNSARRWPADDCFTSRLLVPINERDRSSWRGGRRMSGSPASMDDEIGRNAR